jgi:hypothetical protein
VERVGAKCAFFSMLDTDLAAAGTRWTRRRPRPARR